MLGGGKETDWRYFKLIIFTRSLLLTNKIVLEENRGVLEREVHHLRTLVKDAEKQVARLSEDLNISQQKLERSQEVQNRWKERSEALVEQLQAEQNRTILAEQAITKYINKIQTIKLHYQQVKLDFVVTFPYSIQYVECYSLSNSTPKKFNNLAPKTRFINRDLMKWTLPFKRLSLGRSVSKRNAITSTVVSLKLTKKSAFSR